MRRSTPVLILLCVASAALLAMGVYFGALFAAHGLDPDFLAIDSCLDAGGRWNASAGRCERRL